MYSTKALFDSRVSNHCERLCKTILWNRNFFNPNSLRQKHKNLRKLNCNFWKKSQQNQEFLVATITNKNHHEILYGLVILSPGWLLTSLEVNEKNKSASYVTEQLQSTKSSDGKLNITVLPRTVTKCRRWRLLTMNFTISLITCFYFRNNNAV